MTLKTYTYEGSTSGAALTNAATGGAVSGTGTHSETAVTGAMHGNLAGQYQTTAASSTSITRYTADANNTQMAGHVYFKAPSAPSAITTFATVRHTSGQAFNISYRNDNKIQITDVGSAHTLVDTALVLTPGKWYRYEWVATAGADTSTGKLASNIYDGDGTTPLNASGTLSSTALNLGTNPLTGGDVGISNQVQATMVIDDVAFNDGATTEIGPPSTPLATPTVTTGNTTDPTTNGGTDGTLAASWAAVPNATTYDAYLATKTNPAQTDFTLVQAGVTSPYTFTGLAAGTYVPGIKARP